ncbi:MAG: VWA domain-containing protein [Pedosphaera sp.]|nr:VWA domain-containing protein [Pedosphaera sp.]MSS99918.1 VWA domain-containing protein [Pedosphaera sp.]
MNFAQPYWLLLLLLLPFAAWLKGRRGPSAAFVYSSTSLVREVMRSTRSRAGGFLAALRWLVLAAGIVALAGPRLPEGGAQLTASGIDIVISLDLSDSMAAEDFERDGEPIDRLTIAKEVLGEFIKSRPSDRIGLIVFSGTAYIAAAPTLDHDYLLANVRRFTIDTVPEEGTAIGSGLSAAVNRLRDLKSKSKIVILMTDGQNNSGKIPPLAAAEAAQALGVKVYTIGVGARGTAKLPRKDPFGRKVYVPMNVDIDDEMLTKIATRTGGKYYRAISADTLRQVYGEIDRMEKTTAQAKLHQRYRELFPWLTVAALALLLLELLLANTVWRKLP